MKNLTLTILTLLLAGMAFGQSKPKLKYYRIEAEYQTDCKSSVFFQTWASIYEPTYPQVYSKFKIWVKGHKILSFKIIKWQKLSKPDKSKGNVFECYEPIKFNLDTGRLTSSLLYTGPPITSFTPLQPSSIFWQWGDGKMPMKWLPKPNMSNIDSVEIYVQKKLTYWLNDSTLIIKKP